MLTVESERLLAVNQVQEDPPNTSIEIVSPSQIVASIEVVRSGSGLMSMEIVSFLVHPLAKLPVNI